MTIRPSHTKLGALALLTALLFTGCPQSGGNDNSTDDIDLIQTPATSASVEKFPVPEACKIKNIGQKRQALNEEIRKLLSSDERIGSQMTRNYDFRITTRNAGGEREYLSLEFTGKLFGPRNLAYFARLLEPYQVPDCFGNIRVMDIVVPCQEPDQIPCPGGGCANPGEECKLAPPPKGPLTPDLRTTEDPTKAQ